MRVESGIFLLKKPQTKEALSWFHFFVFTDFKWFASLSWLRYLREMATSALDNTSEKHVQKEIEKLKSKYNTTIISIAHRLTTLQNCDEIIVIDKGKIIQRGTFNQLSNMPGVFQYMKNGVLK